MVGFGLVLMDPPAYIDMLYLLDLSLKKYVTENILEMSASYIRFPNFSLIVKDRKQEEKSDTISLEELIEKERLALSSNNTTKLTLETFLQWKKRKLKEKKEAKEKEEEKKRINYKAGHHIGVRHVPLIEF